MGLSPFVVHHERESSRFDLLLARQSEMRNAFYTRCIQKVPAVYLKLTSLSAVTSRQAPILSAVVVSTRSHSFGPTFEPVVLEEFGRMTKKSLGGGLMKDLLIATVLLAGLSGCTLFRAEVEGWHQLSEDGFCTTYVMISF